MVLKGGERGRGGRREEIIEWGERRRRPESEAGKEEETLARSERGRGE